MGGVTSPVARWIWAGASLAVVVFASGSALANSGILAFRGETLHEGRLDPLLVFDGGLSVAIAHNAPGLATHAAEDDDIVLLVLSSGVVSTAPSELASRVLWDERGIGRTVAKLVSEPGGVLLFDTAGNDPEAATLARHASPDGSTITVYFDRGTLALPEPALLPAVAAGICLLGLLGRIRSRARVVGGSHRPWNLDPCRG